MSETKRFHVRDLLTVTTGRLLTKPDVDGNGIENLYQLLGWMTNDEPFTHQLPRFAEECKPWLLRWFPELSQAKVEDLDLALSVPGVSPLDAIEKWLLDLQTVAGLKAMYDVPRIPADDHDRKNPLAELVEMRGSTEGIIVIEAPNQ